jgi:transmembrane sensor
MSNESRVPSGETDWDALARYFAGESSDEERATVRRWLDDHPADAEALAATDSAARRVLSASSPVDVDRAWRRASARLDERPSPTMYAFAPRRSPAIRAAAAAVLVAGGVSLWWFAARPEVAPPTVASREFTTDAGRRDSLVLDDGTRVLLGPGSSLRIDDGYGSSRRDVHLVGEALFDVRHDDARPFVVHVSGVMIQDLGTTFTVRTTNSTAGVTTVAVTAGSVRVTRTTASTDTAVILRQGEVGAVRSTGPIVVRRDDAVGAAIAWTRGQLVFRDAPLAEVAATLRRWYGVEVRIGDSTLNARTFSGSYDGEPLVTVLDAIALGIPARVQRTDSLVIIGGPSGR